MNFFKSILSDDPESPKSDATDPNASAKSPHDDRRESTGVQDDSADGWSFGGLIKTLSTRSESVMETYRRDLMEFGSGLQKETEIIRVAASRAVKDLPASLEAGASAAQGALDGVLKSTADILSKETINFMSDGESETPEASRSLNIRYSRFEAQLGVIQSDLSSFCEDPEDVEDYNRWKLEFQLNERKDDIEDLVGDNGVLESVYRKIVPREVDHEAFWCRYFYRVDKLKQQERVRADLVKRAISADDDEELSWDIEDDEDGANGSESVVKAKSGDDKGESSRSSRPLETLEGPNGELRDEKERNNFNVGDGAKDKVVEPREKSEEDPSSSGKEVKSDEIVDVKRDGDVKNEQIVEKKNNEKVGVEKSENDVSLVLSDKSKVEEEEDLGWDEIEDVGSGDEKKILANAHGERLKTKDIRKQLSAAEDDEDLNWDIDDDDDDGPAKVR